MSIFEVGGERFLTDIASGGAKRSRKLHCPSNPAKKPIPILIEWQEPAVFLSDYC